MVTSGTKSIRSCAPSSGSATTESLVEQAGVAFRALRRGILRSRGFSLHVAVCDSRITRDELIADLDASMPGVAVKRVELTTEDEDILDAVERNAGKAPGEAFMVVGIEQQLADGARAERLLANLNLRRPEWPVRVRGAVVFWLPRRHVGHLMRGAPDFFDWRSDTLEFPELTVVRTRPFASREWEYGADPRFTADERRERIAELRARIAAVSAAGDIPEVVASTLAWWDELADHYRLIGELDEALRIRREEQLPVYERLGDVRSRAVAMTKIARIELQQGNDRDAVERFAESYQVFSHLGDLEGIVYVGIDLGELLCATDEQEQGVAMLNCSREGLLKLGREAEAARVQALLDQMG